MIESNPNSTEIEVVLEANHSQQQLEQQSHEVPETIVDETEIHIENTNPEDMNDKISVKSRKNSENQVLQLEGENSPLKQSPPKINSPNHSEGTQPSESVLNTIQEKEVLIETQIFEEKSQIEEKNPKDNEEPPVIQSSVAENPATSAPEIQENPVPPKETSAATPELYTMEKRMEMANALKEQAKEPIKAKNYPQALALYEQALDLTNPQFFRYANDEVRKEFTILSVNLLNNLAFCYFHLNNFLTAAKISEQTLIIDKTNLKAMYRRAVCYKNLNDIERAFEIIKHAVKNGGNKSSEIYAEFEAIKELYRVYIEKNKQREKEVYSRMVDSTAVQKAKEEEIQKEKQKQIEEAEQEANQKFALNSFLFFGSTAFSFIVASKVLKIDIASRSGFSLASSLSTCLTLTTILPSVTAKSLLGLTSFILFGYMYSRRAISN